MAGVKPSHTPFDPAAHLAKQGWKGKGTALKQGHLTRPLAVVQKKTLSGVGKDRDEAVPFWDNIFAATAASLSLPSSLTSSPAPASPSGASTPVPLHRLADPRTSKTTAWQTGSSSSDHVASSSGTNKQAGLSTAVRISRESARRGLYSKFFRGEVISHEPSPEPEPETEPEAEAKIADEGTVEAATRTGSGSGSGLDKKESKEEKAARRAARAARKEEKRVKREGKEARKVERAEKKRKREAVGGVTTVLKMDTEREEIEPLVKEVGEGEGGADSLEKNVKERKKRKRKDV